jgi:acyl carrier protein
MSIDLHSLLSDVLELDPGALTCDASAENVPEWDSLRALEVVIAIEDATGVRFRAEDMSMFDSVERIRRLLDAYGIEVSDSGGEGAR